MLNWKAALRALSLVFSLQSKLFSIDRNLKLVSILTQTLFTTDIPVLQPSLVRQDNQQ